MKKPMIVCKGLTKNYRRGNTVVTPLEALDLEVPGGRVSRPDGAVGVRENDASEFDIGD